MPVNNNGVDVVEKARQEAAAQQAARDAARDRASVSTKTDENGNSYTTAVAADRLSNQDFLRIMLEEMKMQDPTKPMDSAQLMDSQLKMSTIESNQAMADSIASLQQAYANSSLSTAANMIGRIVENGSTDDAGLLKSYKVETVENKDGTLYLNSRQLVGIRDALGNKDTKELVLYDTKTGHIIEDGEKTDYKIALNGDGRFIYNEDGSIKILDADNVVVTDEAITGKYTYGGSSPVYAENTTLLPLDSIQEVR